MIEIFCSEYDTCFQVEEFISIRFYFLFPLSIVFFQVLDLSCIVKKKNYLTFGIFVMLIECHVSVLHLTKK